MSTSKLHLVAPFTPQVTPAQQWSVSLSSTDGASGYDLALLIDTPAPDAETGWMLELAVNDEGSVSGQITTRPGYDALGHFVCSADSLALYDTHGMHSLAKYPHAILAERGSDDAVGSRLTSAAPALLRTLRKLTDWAREHTSPRDANSPHVLLMEAVELMASIKGDAP